MSIAGASVVSTPNDPVVLSYKALRRSVGVVAFALPLVVVLPYLHFHPKVVLDSISAYYYTGERNLFEGMLCAIALFMFCNRGYDKKDARAGMISAVCAVGLAFCPTKPGPVTSTFPCVKAYWYNELHFPFTIALFATLAYFCIRLFTITSGSPTRQKLRRNRLYRWCGWTIVGAMVAEGVCAGLERYFPSHLPEWWSKVPHLLLVEIVSLWAFGLAWLVKGETFMTDDEPGTTHTVTTDKVLTW